MSNFNYKQLNQKKLNQEQRQAVESQAKMVLVQAGPGTGKTHTLIAKLEQLQSLSAQSDLLVQAETNQSGQAQGGILALTFTQRAAQEIKQRLSNPAPEIFIGTFHSYALRSLKLKPEQVLLGKQRQQILKKVLSAAPDQLGQESSPSIKAKDLGLVISKVKNQALDQVQLPSAYQQLFANYQERLAELECYDYDDLLIKLKDKLLHWPSLPASSATSSQPLESEAPGQVSKQPGRRPQAKGSASLLAPQYILIDEFQDLNAVQLDLVELWLSHARQVFMIGDQQQAIYGFRGAQATSFDDWQQNHPEADLIRLKYNYRSRPAILQAASALFPQQPSLQVAPQAERCSESTKAADSSPNSTEAESNQIRQGAVQVIQTLNQFTEAAFIRQDIEQKLGGTGLLQASDFHQGRPVQDQAAQEQGARFSDFAIIYRTHFLGRTIKAELDKVGIPVQQLGQESLYAQPEVELMLNLLWLLNFKQLELGQRPDQTSPGLVAAASLEPKQIRQDINCILHQHWGQSQAETDLIQDWFQNHQSGESSEKELVSQDLSSQVKQLSGNLKSWLKLKPNQEQNLTQFKNNLLAFQDYANPVRHLFNYVQQLKARDYYDQQADKVSLLTMHAAKGLEFPWVYVVGFEQGQIPFSTASQQQKFYHLSPEVRLQEEKRLLYVAMTRAKYGLYLLTPKFRWRQATEPSRFLELIVDQVELVQDEQLRRYQQRKKEQELADRQKSLF